MSTVAAIILATGAMLGLIALLALVKEGADEEWSRYHRDEERRRE